jgi:hypothetical protein
MGRWEVLAVLIASALVIACLIHVLVERPAQRLLRPRLKAALARIRAGEPPREPPPSEEANGKTPSEEANGKTPPDGSADGERALTGP